MNKPLLSLKRLSKSSSGHNLIELIIALVILAILTGPFLNVMSSFIKTNQMSRLALIAGAESSNQYERLKSLTVMDLAREPVYTATDESRFIIETRLQPYIPGEDSDTDTIDLIIKNDEEESESGFLSCIMSHDLQDLTVLTGLGKLQILVMDQDRRVTIQLSDARGKNSTFSLDSSAQLRVCNIYTQHISRNLEIDLKFNSPIYGAWTINLYEAPYRHGSISFTINEETYQIDPVIKDLKLDNILIHINKTEKNAFSLISATVNIYEDLDDSIPISTRSGIIKASY